MYMCAYVCIYRGRERDDKRRGEGEGYVALMTMYSRLLCIGACLTSKIFRKMRELEGSVETRSSSGGGK